MTASPTTTSARTLLQADHDRLDAVVQELENASEVGVDKRTLGEVWERFEGGLRNHLRTEEEILFPLYVGDHPGEIASLRFDHARLREWLESVGLEVDLGVVRNASIEAMLALLRRHALREEEDLYRWAERDLDEAKVARLAEQVRVGSSTGEGHKHPEG